MSKISNSFLVCFSLVACTGAAWAQGGLDTSAMSNSLGSSVSMDGMRASVKLGATTASNPYAQAASSLNAAPAGAGTGIDIPVVQAKIGGGAANLSLPASPLTGASSNMANSLQAPASSATGDMTSSVVLGAATPDLSNAIGDQVRSNAKLGK